MDILDVFQNSPMFTSRLKALEVKCQEYFPETEIELYHFADGSGFLCTGLTNTPPYNIELGLFWHGKGYRPLKLFWVEVEVSSNKLGSDGKSFLCKQDDKGEWIINGDLPDHSGIVEIARQAWNLFKTLQLSSELVWD